MLLRLKKLLKTFSVLVIFLSSIFFTTTFLLTNAFTSSPNAPLSIIEKTIEEKIIGGTFNYMQTITYYRETVFQFNVTILPQSNSSVAISYEELPPDYFSPALTNFTLAPGESFQETYTIVFGEAAELFYYCRCTNSESNATLVWWYEAISTPTALIGTEFLFLTGTFLVTFLTLVLSFHKKAINKKK